MRICRTNLKLTPVRAWSLLIALLLLPLRGEAGNFRVIVNWPGERFHLYINGAPSDVQTVRVFALINMLDSFCSQASNDAVLIKVNWDADCYYGHNMLLEKPAYTLGRYATDFWQERDNDGFVKTSRLKQAIVLNIHTPYLSYTEIFRLLKYATANVGSIERSQKLRLRYYGDGGLSRRVYSIPDEEIEYIRRDIKLDTGQSFLHARYYRSGMDLQDRWFDVYYKDDSLHLFTTPHTPLTRALLKDAVRLNAIALTVASFRNIDWIEKLTSNTYMIAVGDTAYVFNEKTREIKGPVWLPVLDTFHTNGQYLMYVDTLVDSNTALVEIGHRYDRYSRPYKAIFNFEKITLEIDTVSFNKSIRDYPTELKEAHLKQLEEQSSRLKEIELQRRKKIFVLVFSISILLLTIFLATTKRL